MRGYFTVALVGSAPLTAGSRGICQSSSGRKKRLYLKSSQKASDSTVLGFWHKKATQRQAAGSLRFVAKTYLLSAGLSAGVVVPAPPAAGSSLLLQPDMTMLIAQTTRITAKTFFILNSSCIQIGSHRSTFQRDVGIPTHLCYTTTKYSVKQLRLFETFFQEKGEAYGPTLAQLCLLEPFRVSLDTVRTRY